MQLAGTRTRAAVIAVALLVPAAAAASPATRGKIAAKQQQKQAALAELQALQLKLEPAIERWNAANEELKGVNERIATNQRRIAVVQGNLRRTQALLAERIVEDYRSGESDPIATVLAAGSISDMIDSADLLRRSEHQAADLLRQLGANRRELSVRSRQLASDRQRATALLRRRAQEQATIERGMARERHLAASLGTEIAQLKEQEAREQAEAIRRAREIIRRQQAEAARRLAAAAAAAPDPGIGGSAPSTLSAGSSSSSSSSSGSSGPSASSGSSAAAEVAPPPPPSNGSLGQRAVAAAMTRLGSPYVWGASGPSSFDCSGLTMWAYAQVGVSLGHFTGAQWNEGAHVGRGDLQPGDLVFFHSDLHHMGMYIGGGSFIHAPHTGDVVKISSLSGYYASNYAGAVRPG